MNKESEIWQFAASKLERGEYVMLLVVAESSGSSPGRQGFKMIVAEDEMCGSIGGGVMEVDQRLRRLDPECNAVHRHQGRQSGGHQRVQVQRPQPGCRRNY